MKKIIFIGLLFASTCLKAQNATVDTSQVGKNLTVCGYVESVNMSSKSKITFINYVKKDSPYIGVIYAKDTINFTEYKPTEFLTGKNVCISGVVSLYKGTPQIVITTPKQIRLQER